MTIQMASQRIGKSETTIRRWIKSGKLSATIVDGVYDISEDSILAYSNDQSMNSQPEGVDKALIDQLRSENEYLKERIQELEQARERADLITMQLTRQLEQSQRMLEAHKEPFWKRWLRKERG